MGKEDSTTSGGGDAWCDAGTAHSEREAREVLNLSLVCVCGNLNWGQEVRAAAAAAVAAATTTATDIVALA